jgi:ABC-2 type transport system permease protein
MNKIKTIILKEWAEVFKNRLVLFTVAFLPLILTALPLIMLAFAGGIDEDTAGAAAAPGEFFGEQCEGLSELDCTQVYTLNLFALMFMILPVAIPVTIAAYSIVGEKTARSLEPLLATPITTVELVAAKSIAAVVPAIGATWLSFAIYMVSVSFMVNDVVYERLTDPMWFIAIFLVGPLLTLMAVSIAIMISSRVTDPRVAEQVSAVVVLPIIMLIVGQSVGWILIDSQLVLLFAGLIGLLDIGLVFMSVKIFQRETILTRWK